MIEKTIQFTTDTEDEYIRLFTGTGMHRNVARVLVFFSTTKTAVCHDIERRTGLSQPEVCVALKYLEDRGWIVSRKSYAEKQGRPAKLCTLALPFGRIMDAIENETLHEMDVSRDRFQRIRDCI